MTRPIRIAPTGPVHTLGVRFRPGGAREILGLPVDRLTDEAARAEELWGVEGRRVEDEVGNAVDDASRRAVIERFLESRLARSRAGSPRLARAVGAILASRGRLPVAEVARRAGWGPRQLEREFRAGVGLAPKALSRIIRFQNLLLPGGPPSRRGLGGSGGAVRIRRSGPPRARVPRARRRHSGFGRGRLRGARPVLRRAGSPRSSPVGPRPGRCRVSSRRRAPARVESAPNEGGPMLAALLALISFCPAAAPRTPRPSPG